LSVQVLEALIFKRLMLQAEALLQACNVQSDDISKLTALSCSLEAPQPARNTSASAVLNDVSNTHRHHGEQT
jgi:hypothetical protein